MIAGLFISNPERSIPPLLKGKTLPLVHLYSFMKRKRFTYSKCLRDDAPAI